MWPLAEPSASGESPAIPASPPHPDPPFYTGFTACERPTTFRHASAPHQPSPACLMELLSVPFTNTTWTPAYDGMITVRGVLATRADGLVLEYAFTENYWGVKPTVESGIRTVPVPWTEIQSLVYRPRLFGWGGSLVLRTRSLRALDGVPTARGSEISFSIPRADRLEARELAVTVEMALADRRLAALESPSTPPTLPPA